MAMKKCKECGTEISSSAKVCPNCGKKQKLSGCLIAIIVIVLLLIIVASSGGDNSSQNTSKTTLSEGNAGETSSTVQTENQSTPETKTKYSVGEVFENDYIAVKYVSVDEDFKGYSKYADIKSGYKIIKADFEFENVSNSDQYTSAYDFDCYADGYDCESFFYFDNSGFSTSLSAGKKATGSVCFQVPIDATEISIEYETNYWSSEHIEFIVK